MSKEITIDSHVKANRDIPNKGVYKYDSGKVTNIELIDSEIYLDILMANGQHVYQSCDNCWDLVKS